MLFILTYLLVCGAQPGLRCATKLECVKRPEGFVQNSCNRFTKCLLWVRMLPNPIYITARQVNALSLTYKHRQLFYRTCAHVVHMLLFRKSLLLATVELKK